MIYFKHACDAHRGKSMHTLFEELGHAGPLSYWVLVEMCTEKLWERGQPTAETECIFEFHIRIVLNNLRISRRNFQKFLNSCRKLSLFSYELTGNQLKINIPKLLEVLHRDHKRARRERATGAAPARLELELDLELDKEKNKKENETARADGAQITFVEAFERETTGELELSKNERKEFLRRLKAGETPVEILSDLRSRSARAGEPASAVKIENEEIKLEGVH